MFNYNNINELYQKVKIQFSEPAKAPNFEKERWPAAEELKGILTYIFTNINDSSGELKKTKFTVLVGGSTPWQYINALINKRAIADKTDTDTYAIASLEYRNNVRRFKSAIKSKLQEIYHVGEKEIFSSNLGDVISVKSKGYDANLIEDVEVFFNFQVFINDQGDVVYASAIPTHEEDFKKFIFEHKIICYTQKVENLIEKASVYVNRIREAKKASTYTAEFQKFQDNTSEGQAVKKLAFIFKSLYKPFRAGKRFDYGTAKFMSEFFKNTENNDLIELITDRIHHHYGDLFPSIGTVRAHLLKIKAFAKEDVENAKTEEKLQYAEAQANEYKEKAMLAKRESQSLHGELAGQNIALQNANYYTAQLQNQLHQQSYVLKETTEHFQQQIIGQSDYIKKQDEMLNYVIGKNNNLNLTLTQKNSSESEMKQKIEESDKKIAKLTAENELLKAQKVTLETDAASKKDTDHREASALTSQIENLKSKNKALETDLGVAKSQAALLNTQLVSRAEQIKSLSQQLEKEKTSMKSLAKSHADSDSQHKANDKKNQLNILKLSEDMKKIEDSIYLLENKVKQADAEKLKLQKEKQKIHEELEQLREKIQVLEKTALPIQEPVVSSVAGVAPVDFDDDEPLSESQHKKTKKRNKKSNKTHVASSVVVPAYEAMLPKDFSEPLPLARLSPEKTLSLFEDSGIVRVYRNDGNNNNNNRSNNNFDEKSVEMVSLLPNHAAAIGAAFSKQFNTTLQVSNTSVEKDKLDAFEFYTTMYSNIFLFLMNYKEGLTLDDAFGFVLKLNIEEDEYEHPSVSVSIFDRLNEYFRNINNFFAKYADETSSVNAGTSSNLIESLTMKIKTIRDMFYWGAGFKMTKALIDKIDRVEALSAFYRTELAVKNNEVSKNLEKDILTIASNCLFKYCDGKLSWKGILLSDAEVSFAQKDFLFNCPENKIHLTFDDMVGIHADIMQKLSEETKSSATKAAVYLAKPTVATAPPLQIQDGFFVSWYETLILNRSNVKSLNAFFLDCPKKFKHSPEVLLIKHCQGLVIVRQGAVRSVPKKNIPHDSFLYTDLSPLLDPVFIESLVKEKKSKNSDITSRIEEKISEAAIALIRPSYPFRFDQTNCLMDGRERRRILSELLLYYVKNPMLPKNWVSVVEEIRTALCKEAEALPPPPGCVRTILTFGGALMPEPGLTPSLKKDNGH